MTTSDRFLRASRPRIAAISSMRLLVVEASPPEISFSCFPDLRIAAHPPGPGFPEQAPSVKISTEGIVKRRTPPRNPLAHESAGAARIHADPWDGRAAAHRGRGNPAIAAEE